MPFAETPTYYQNHCPAFHKITRKALVDNPSGSMHTARSVVNFGHPGMKKSKSSLKRSQNVIQQDDLRLGVYSPRKSDASLLTATQG